MRLTRPVSPGEARRYRDAGHWDDTVAAEGSALAAHGDRTAIVDRTGDVTYRQLATTTEAAASGLRHLGVQSGDAVLVVTDNDRHSVVACHAVWRLGAVALLVHRSSGRTDITFACAASEPAAVLLAPGAETFRADLETAGSGVHAVADLQGLGGTPPPPVDVDPDAPRLVVFTSGTTASPKGVVHTANTLRASAANYRSMTDLTAGERFFVVSPLASMAGVLQVLVLAPALGAVSVLENAWDPESSLELLRATGGTFYGGTDNVLARLFESARRQEADIPLRAVAVGGAMLRRDVLEEAESRFGICVLRVYGSSEAPNSTGARPEEPREVRLADDGTAAPGVEVRLADGAAQEVLLRGPHVFRGYLDPGDNEGVFDGDWFRTGDAAELEGGRLRVVGRLKEVASRNGRKVSLAEVEESFRAAIAVDDCAAFGVPDGVTGERVAIAVAMPEDRALDVPAALDAMVAAGLARWKLPESVVRYTTALPRTATGKVQRRALSERQGLLLWRADRLAASP